jgi:hypothetical protein
VHFHQELASQQSFEMLCAKRRVDLFLDEINVLVPWAQLLASVETYQP